MALTGKKPGASYKDLLYMDNSNAGVDGTLRAIKDGEDTLTKIKVSSTETTIEGTGGNSVQIGSGADASGSRAIAIGEGATASSTYSVAIGRNSEATFIDGVALGFLAKANADLATALGYSADATTDSAVAVGAFAEANGEGSVAIGRAAVTSVDGELCMTTGANMGSPFPPGGTERSIISNFFGVTTVVADTGLVKFLWADDDNVTVDAIEIKDNSGFAFSLSISALAKPTGTSTYNSDLFAMWTLDNVFVYKDGSGSGNMAMVLRGGSGVDGSTGGFGGGLGTELAPTAYGGGNSNNWRIKIDEDASGDIEIFFGDPTTGASYDIVARAFIKGQRFVNHYNL